MVKIAVLGHGVVGSGVCEVIMTNKQSISKRAGRDIEVKKILDLRDFPDCGYPDKFTKNYDDILNDDEISIVVEVMGGINPAYEYTQNALKKGKSVVSSNKELVAAHGAELLKLASQNNVNYFFEASVGGGIPIIRPMHLCLAANEIEEIEGILNGTTNFILTKMIKEKMDFETALKQAQDLGYAERNPAADVEGHDACRKICILASLAFGRQISPDSVHTEGITAIKLEDVEYAADWGGVIKLIGRAARESDGHVQCMVSPAFVPDESQLAHIDDVFNGVLVHGNATGDVVFYGKGAGKLPTASAVVADVIDITKESGTSKSLYWEECSENIVTDYLKTSSRFYLRLQCENPNAVAKEFGEIELLERKNKPHNEIAFVTSEIKENDFQKKIAALEEKGVKILGTIRALPCCE